MSEEQIEVEIDVEIELEDEVEIQLEESFEEDVHPNPQKEEAIVEDFESVIEDEMDIEVEIQADELINVEVEAPVVEVEIEVPLSVELIVEMSIQEPMLEAGGNADQKPSNPIINLVCAIVFALLFVGSSGVLIYFICSYDSTLAHWKQGVDRDTALTRFYIIIASAGALMLVMAILSVACYVCYSKKKREIAYICGSVLEESCSEVGGATSLEAQIE